jgi:hypothetical protein
MNVCTPHAVKAVLSGGGDSDQLMLVRGTFVTSGVVNPPTGITIGSYMYTPSFYGALVQ